ncbi:Rieske (2Fe-2S) protein [Paraburkholderia rhynchosiae]|uniref:3-phenylpropionate/cinnamic acid dioxygenase ferredoxin subunit n=1 Tax=Paraburkholderia rhynchosiae TaxID=487049 RepID=A0A2N7W546_9BURK|nr:Rieske 2Fe-2S domain-containing protein [Paraburkholderia rhynchosiae]PMS24522.1 hypothetical protein C0Z16_30890 [Paraburkholderia rhynchosiae]CAB3735712.1 3-phenylpropionate/cinnamic acid dioxygenase ferredoxin subunit [Paraburkholderia rhynchosiae]
MQVPEQWLAVARFAELPNGNFKCFDVEGVSLLLCRVGERVFAVANNCPHQNLRMDKAIMQEYEIVCPHHGASFDIRDGRRLDGPSVFPLCGYPCRVVDSQVLVDVAHPETSMARHMEYLADRQKDKRTEP